MELRSANLWETPGRLWSRRSAAAMAGVVALFGMLLIFEGRPAWCKSGFAWWSAAWTSCTSQQVFDPYSLSHVLHGVIFCWLLRPLAGRMPLTWRFVAAIGLEVGWELLENSAWIIERYRQETAAFDYTGDSIVNSLGDVFSAAVGFVVAAWLSWQAVAVFFVALELWMLWLARDNLSLNVLMLLHPIDAIKAWQLAGVETLGP